MNIPIAIIVGFCAGVVAVLLIWSRAADSNDIETARREDSAYLRGYHRGLTGKAPQLSNIHTNP